MIIVGVKCPAVLQFTERVLTCRELTSSTVSLGRHRSRTRNGLCCSERWKNLQIKDGVKIFVKWFVHSSSILFPECKLHITSPRRNTNQGRKSIHYFLLCCVFLYCFGFLHSRDSSYVYVGTPSISQPSLGRLNPGFLSDPRGACLYPLSVIVTFVLFLKHHLFTGPQVFITL